MVSWKIAFFEKLILETDLEPILGRFWVDLGAKKGANMAPKTDKKWSKNMLNFKTIFEQKKSEKGRTGGSKPEQLKTESADWVRQSKPMADCSEWVRQS